MGKNDDQARTRPGGPDLTRPYPHRIPEELRVRTLSFSITMTLGRGLDGSGPPFYKDYNNHYA